MFEKLETHRLPSFNPILVELIDVCNREDVTFKTVADIINRDAALTVKVLTIVNSAAFAPVQPLISLERAVVTLGIDTIKMLAITASIRQILEQIKIGPVFDMKRFWRRSLCCGVLARALADLTGYNRPDEAYLAGLLHNIGELLIVINFPLECQHLMKPSADELLLQERKQFGFNRCDAGAWLVDQWNLSLFISDAIRYQRESIEQIQEAHELVKLIALASYLSRDTGGQYSHAYTVADRLFGLTQNLVKKLTQEAREQVALIAAGMSIELGREPFEQPRNSVASALEDGLIIQSDRSTMELANRIQEEALIACMRTTFDAAENEDQLFDGIQAGAYILFGSKQVLVFLMDNSKQALVGVSSDNQTSLVSEITISAKDNNSIIALCYNKRRPVQSFAEKDQPVVSVIDRQVAKLCLSDGIFCLPIHNRKTVFGVLAIGIQELQLPRYQKQLKLLQGFSYLVGTSFAGLQQTQAVKINTTEDKRKLDLERVRELVHEANNPLSILKNYINVLNTKLEGVHEAELKIINDEIDRVGRIIRQICEEGDTNKKYSDIDINAVLSDLITLCRDSYMVPANIKLTYVPDEMMHRIGLNQDTLKQVLINLIKNAVEALSETGSIKITTKSDLVFKRKKYVEIVISDNGPGIPSDIFADLFSPMTSTKGENRGIGLVIVKNLITEMRGFIHCKSSEGKGTSFQILLPRA